MKIRTMAVASALLLALAGCQDAASEREAPPTLSASERAEDVKQLCDFFATRPLEVLGTPQAEGNVTLLAAEPGVSTELRTLAKAYYDGGYGGKPDTPARKEAQEGRYLRVLAACRNAGTGWTRP